MEDQISGYTKKKSTSITMITWRTLTVGIIPTSKCMLIALHWSLFCSNLKESVNMMALNLKLLQKWPPVALLLELELHPSRYTVIATAWLPGSTDGPEEGSLHFWCLLLFQHLQNTTSSSEPQSSFDNNAKSLSVFKLVSLTWVSWFPSKRWSSRFGRPCHLDAS